MKLAGHTAGAVKITPGHDHNDYEVGKRHELPFITVINDNGLMTKDCGSQFEVSFGIHILL